MLTAVTRLLEIVGLTCTRWLECGLVKAEMIVFFVSISLLRFGDACSMVVWIATFVESLIVRRLEIVVDLSALLLLAQSEVVALQLGPKVQVLGMLCNSARITLSLGHELMLGFRLQLCRDSIADRNVSFLKLGAHLSAVGSLASLFGLLINLRLVQGLVLAHARCRVSKAELSLGHTSFEFFSVVVLVARNLVFIQI